MSQRGLSDMPHSVLVIVTEILGAYQKPPTAESIQAKNPS
jgi:hypothetical protein